MASIKSLVKDTAIYGLSSIVGRLINYVLSPFYTFMLATTADNGLVTSSYAWIALAMALLTYGMETGFFRFANKEGENSETVYSTVLGSLAITSTLFILLTLYFSSSITQLLGFGNHQEYVIIMCATVGIDAFSSVCFAYLRFLKRPVRFALLKTVSIAINVGLNLFFFLGLPWLCKHFPTATLLHEMYHPENLVVYIFISNFVATLVVLFLLSPYFIKIHWGIDRALLRRILAYSLPLLIVSLAGIVNDSGDKLLYTHLSKAPNALSELGIYGANYKLAAIILMCTQAFRFAFEPFIFAQSKNKDSSSTYARIMTYFVIFGLVVWVSMVLFLDLAKHVNDSKYYEGIKIVPIVLAANFFLGIFFNLSVWYKLSDKTRYGAYFAIGGALITLSINVLFVNKYGYMACAWATFICYFFMMVISYLYGRKHYPLPYQLKRIGTYTLAALSIYLLDRFIIQHITNTSIEYLAKSVLLFLFVATITIYERKKMHPCK